MQACGAAEGKRKGLATHARRYGNCRSRQNTPRAGNEDTRSMRAAEIALNRRRAGAAMRFGETATAFMAYWYGVRCCRKAGVAERPPRRRLVGGRLVRHGGIRQLSCGAPQRRSKTNGARRARPKVSAVWVRGSRRRVAREAGGGSREARGRRRRGMCRR